MKNHIERNYDSIIEILEKDIKAEKELIELLETSNKILNPIDLFEYVEIIEEKLQMITYLEVSDGKLDVPDEKINHLKKLLYENLDYYSKVSELDLRNDGSLHYFIRSMLDKDFPLVIGMINILKPMEERININMTNRFEGVVIIG